MIIPINKNWYYIKNKPENKTCTPFLLTFHLTKTSVVFLNLEF